MDQSSFVKNALKLDDLFRFHCNQCGQCCRNREDILLSPYDLNRIALALSRPRRSSTATATCMWVKTAACPS